MHPLSFVKVTSSTIHNHEVWVLDAKLQMRLGTLSVTAKQKTDGCWAVSRSMLDLYMWMAFFGEDGRVGR